MIAAARSPEKAKEIGVPVVLLDLDKVETIEPALKGIDLADFCAQLHSTGTRAFRW